MIVRGFILAGLALFTSGCGSEPEKTTAPLPAAMTDDAVGYFCQMSIFEHEGPKAQIFVAGEQDPLWFSQVRDGIVFTRLPEETREVTAFYVNDMGNTDDWTSPGIDNWIDASDAYFVIESKRRGGMGASEAVPFGDKAKALKYIEKSGGRVVRLSDIPDTYVLGPEEMMTSHEGMKQ
jgi:copper chaperone NosL